MRTIVIGDIHGCIDELETLLDKISISENEDRVIFVGDLIDRGADPYLVIDRVRSLKKAMGERCTVIRGNHEQMMLNSIYDPGEKFLWMANGASRTIRSFYRHKKTIGMAREWLLSMEMYLETDDFIVAHAGISPMGPEKTDDDTFLWDRSIAEYGTHSGKLFIYGHTPMKEAVYHDGHGRKAVLEDDIECELPPTGSICIDTGCVYGNKLTAMVIEDGRFVLRAAASGKAINLLA